MIYIHIKMYEKNNEQIKIKHIQGVSKKAQSSTEM
jgi:hypothetical protein